MWRWWLIRFAVWIHHKGRKQCRASLTNEMVVKRKSQRQLLECLWLRLSPSRAIFQWGFACFFGNKYLDWLILSLIVVVISAVWQISQSFSTYRHMYKQMVGLYFLVPLCESANGKSCKEKWCVTVEPDYLIAGVRSFRACSFPSPQRPASFQIVPQSARSHNEDDMEQNSQLTPN